MKLEDDLQQLGLDWMGGWPGWLGVRRRPAGGSMSVDEGSDELGAMDIWEGWERGERSVVVWVPSPV